MALRIFKLSIQHWTACVFAFPQKLRRKPQVFFRLTEISL